MLSELNPEKILKSNLENFLGFPLQIYLDDRDLVLEVSRANLASLNRLLPEIAIKLYRLGIEGFTTCDSQSVWLQTTPEEILKAIRALPPNLPDDYMIFDLNGQVIEGSRLNIPNFEEISNFCLEWQYVPLVEVAAKGVLKAYRAWLVNFEGNPAIALSAYVVAKADSGHNRRF
jgi:hypothetical protein